MLTNEFQPLALRPGGPKLHDRITPDVRYWSKYRKPTLHKETAQIRHLNFADLAPYLLSVTSGSKVQIYHPSTHEVAKTITRFNDLAYSGHLRADGKLLVAGDERGTVSVFETGSRSILRSFNGHSGPVHFTRFALNNTHVFSGSDDKTARIWDIASNAVVNCFESHTDYVRAGVVSPDNPNLVMTASYDHTVRVWDVRTNTSVMTMSHDAPVESMLMFPGSNALVSCGGPYFKVFDLATGGRVLHQVSNHQKTITTMAFDHSGSRLLTGSLDQSVKIYNVSNFKVVHTLKYSSPILSLAVSPNDTHMAVGMLDGTLSFRSREVNTDDVRSESGLPASYRVGSYRYFMRGQGYQPTGSDYKVEAPRRPKFASYDVFLRKYQYSNALDVVFETKLPPITTVTVLEELMDRGGLRTALQGRTEEQLEPILAFLGRYITHPHYSETLCTVSHVVFDIYGPVLPKSDVLKKWAAKVKNKLNEERGIVRELAKVLGALDMVLANSAKTSELSVTWRESDEELIQRVVNVQLEETLMAAEERMRRIHPAALNSKPSSPTAPEFYGVANRDVEGEGMDTLDQCASLDESNENECAVDPNGTEPCDQVTPEDMNVTTSAAGNDKPQPTRKKASKKKKKKKEEC